jgi:predicted nucleic acid-binding protein
MSSAATVAERSGVLYADTSALVKLVVREAETDALRVELEQWRDVATSVITEIELSRAAARVRSTGTQVINEIDVRAITAAALEIELTPAIRRAAAGLGPVVLRTLDCIHVASALSLGDDLAGVLTYDERMQRAVTVAGVDVLSPT